MVQIAAVAVPAGRGWVWNQALIEFGALRCTARRPGCADCPVQASCRAFPAIEKLSSAQPRRGPAKPSSRYEGTNRYFRGRVLAALRELPTDQQDGLDLRTLGEQLRADFTEDQLPWISDVVESLRRDGLAAVSAIAEEGPAYDVGGGSAILTGDERVTLP